MTTRIAAIALATASLAHAQFGRGAAEWTTTGGDAQRSSWIRTDPKITKQSVQKPGFQMLWKVKFANEPNQLNALTTPALLGSYIGYRGFRSLAFIGGSSDTVFAVDTDLGHLEWQKQITLSVPSKPGTAACPGGITSAVTRITGLAFPGAAAGGRGGRGGPAKSGVGDAGEGAVTIAEVAANAARGAGRGPDPAAGGRGGRNPTPNPYQRAQSYVYVLSGDGMLHAMYVSNGDEPSPPIPFLPAGANATGLIVNDGFAYVTTSHGCGGAADGVYALEQTSQKVRSWKSQSGSVAGTAGAAISPEAVLYVATEGGELVALEPKTLEMKDAYKAGPGFTASPVIFQFKDKTLLAALAKDGALHILDADDIKTALVKSAANPAVANPEAGALATWQDSAGTRWILAPGKNAIVAWKVNDDNGKPKLQTGWTSREMVTPMTPIIVNGVIFAVAGGNRSTNAVLYALDPDTGKELWSSGKNITSFVHSGNLAVGGSQLYLGTYDGNFYAFGMWIEH